MKIMKVRKLQYETKNSCERWGRSWSELTKANVLIRKERKISYNLVYKSYNKTVKYLASFSISLSLLSHIGNRQEIHGKSMLRVQLRIKDKHLISIL